MDTEMSGDSFNSVTWVLMMIFFPEDDTHSINEELNSILYEKQFLAF